MKNVCLQPELRDIDQLIGSYLSDQLTMHQIREHVGKHVNKN
jgi:hypothetical protein